MKFIQPLMHNGEPNPGRWVSSCKNYAIEKYLFYPNSIGRMEKCKPWFGVYLSSTGRNLHKKYSKLTFNEAVKIAEKHHEELHLR
jgi:hypothetical protein